MTTLLALFFGGLILSLAALFGYLMAAAYSDDGWWGLLEAALQLLLIIAGTFSVTWIAYYIGLRVVEAL